MAAYGWRSASSVEDFLFAEGHRFDFFAAVRLLERMRPEGVPVGTGPNPASEAVRFSSRVGFNFPPTDVDAISPSSGPEQPAGMRVNFIGLAGALGPLPAPFVEWILDRVRAGDTAFRDFLDIFNHRLTSLMFRVRKQHRVGLDFRAPDQTHFADYCFSMLGLGTPGLKGRMGIGDRSLLFYSGLLCQQPRSMAGLEALLSHYFEIGVQGRQFVGQWYPLASDQQTMIGRRGRNQRLGRGAVLGARVWEQGARFELKLGPLSFAQFQSFLPEGEALGPLCNLVRFYAGREAAFDLRLVLKADQVPASRLDTTDGPRLGRTSWLRTQIFKNDDSQVRIRVGDAI